MLRALASLEHGWQAGARAVQRFRRQFLVVAATVIVVGLVMTLDAHPEILENLSWRGVALLAFLMTPFMILLGAMEFVVLAACVNTSVTLARGLFVTVIGAVINLVPVPGAMVTRIAALKAAGATTRSSARIILLQGLLWLAITMVLGGAAISVAGLKLTGAFVAVAGLILVATVVGLIATECSSILEISKLATIRSLLVFCDGLRVSIALEAMGTEVPIYQAMIFTLASSFGSALSIIPVGLGIRELISAALAPVAGIPIAIGFAAAVLIRLVDLAVMTVLAIALAFGDKSIFGKKL